jgi:LTXXQ motif family protein
MLQSSIRIATFLALSVGIAGTAAGAPADKPHGGPTARAAPAPRAAAAPHISAPRAAPAPQPRAAAGPHISAPRVAPQPSARSRGGPPPAALTRQAAPTPKALAPPQQEQRQAGSAASRAAPAGREAARPGPPDNVARQRGADGRQLAQPSGRDDVTGPRGPADRAGPSVVRPNQPPQLAGVSRAPSDRVLRNQAFPHGSPRNAAEHAFARSAFQGRFADHSGQWRRRHHRSFVIGWVGPLFWPYAYNDFVDYTFYSYGYDTFWPYAYDDLYEGVFGRYAYGGAYAAVRPPASERRGGGKSAIPAADLCSAQTAGLTDWPIEQIAQTVQPDDAQRAALDGLKAATAKALDMLRSACPTELPGTPTGRLAAMRQRLEVMLQAVQTIRPALGTFYQSLNDEQKARFNALGPDDSPDQQQSRRDLTQMCGERASGIASLPLERIERAVRPDEGQRNALKELQDAASEAVNLLRSDCPTYRALTPVGRLEAMEQRLDAMLRAVLAVQPALEKFYGSLGDEQKERFNRLAPAQG